MLDTTLNARVQVFLDKFEARLWQAILTPPWRCSLRMLLARPRCLHLEHQDHGRPRSDLRHAQLLPSARKAEQLENR